MINQLTSPDDLIAQLQEAAAEYVSVDAAEFAAAARDELSAYREEQQAEAPGRREELPERRKRGIVVPERYGSSAEQFVVFDVFVRCFVDPVLIASAIPGLLVDGFRQERVDRVSFRRFGEERGIESPFEELRALTYDAREITAGATEIGRALFGDKFRRSDFWEAR